MALTRVSSGMITFLQKGLGAVLRSLQDKLREFPSVDDYRLPTDTDDTAAFQRAVAAVTSGTASCLRLVPGKIYSISSQITIAARRIVIEGNNATVNLTANANYAFYIDGENCEVRNLELRKNSNVTAQGGFFIKGNQHVFRNVTSRDQKWPVVFRCQDMKESHFSEIRVDNDVSGKTGNIFTFDYCVNNTVSDSMLGFCAQAFYGSSTGQPTSNYHNEGLLITNVITVYAGKAVNFDNGTFISISNCVFDFCELFGVFLSNGTDLKVTGTWIASNATNGFLGIGATANVRGVTAVGNTLVMGGAVITGTAGFSLPCTDCLVVANRLSQGMNGGVITHPTSQVGFNCVDSPGTAIIATEPGVSVRGSMAISETLAVGKSLTVGDSQGIYPIALSGGATAGANGVPPTQVAAYAKVQVGGQFYMLPLYNV